MISYRWHSGVGVVRGGAESVAEVERRPGAATTVVGSAAANASRATKWSRTAAVRLRVASTVECERRAAGLLGPSIPGAPARRTCYR